MSSDESDSGDQLPTLEELQKWKKKELQKFLVDSGLPKSGDKNTLSHRVYRAMRSGHLDSSHSDLDSDEGHQDADGDIPPPETLKDWTEPTTEKIPKLTNEDVKNYFIYRKNPINNRRLNATRPMKKARRMANEDFIANPMYHEISTDSAFCYFKANCKASMRAQIFYVTICMTKTSGYIESAVCTCEAGQSGVCAHVGALLFTLCKQKSACTSQPCVWNRPRNLQRPLSPKLVRDIPFHKTEIENQEFSAQAYPGVYRSSKCNDPEKFLQDIMLDLGEANPSCVLYQTLSYKPFNIDFFVDMYSPNYRLHDSVDLSDPPMQEIFGTFCDNLSLTANTGKELERSTRGQSINSNWIKARSVLVTASNFGEICKRKATTQPDNLVKRLRNYTSPPAHVRSLVHGRNMESKAKRDYGQFHSVQCKTQIEIDNQGLAVNPKYPFLGASVDGLVRCPKCGLGIVEIKCPYGKGKGKQERKWRNMTVEQCAKDSDFYATIVNDKVLLKRDHKYYLQIQGQMAVCEVEFVDFVLWTNRNISVERIKFDKDFWEFQMLPKLRTFYVQGMVAELFTDRIRRGKALYE